MFEELFELIFFFVPLAFILYLRFFHNRRSTNQNEQRPPGILSRGVRSVQKGLESLFTETGETDEDLMNNKEGLPSRESPESKPPGQVAKPKTLPYKKIQSHSVMTQVSGLYSIPAEDPPQVSSRAIPGQSTAKELPARLQKLTAWQRAVALQEILGKPKGLSD